MPFGSNDEITLGDTRFRYMNRVLSREQLRIEVEAEVAGLDPEQWFDGEFRFDEWLSDSIITRHVTRVDDDEFA
ncbi:hypothetical protein L2K20_29110 [Mycobacterium sp. MBM]|nr:hypothetical protein [Mycobacterium sp. MBM]